MGYRTYINDKQFFGSNQRIDEWIDFIKSQGIEVDEDDAYDGYITDVMGAITTLESISMKEEEKIRNNRETLPGNVTSIFDFSPYYNELMFSECINTVDKKSLLDYNFDMIEHGKAMLAMHFVQSCWDLIEHDKCFSTLKHFECYKIKEGCKIHVKAD